MRKLILMIALVPALIYCQVPKLVDVPAVTEKAATTETPATPAETKPATTTSSETSEQTVTNTSTAITAQPADEETSDKDKKNPGVKVVTYLLDGFRKMGDNRNKFLDGNQSYEKYMAKDAELTREISFGIDYYDVCEKSLKYDYDAKRKTFKKDHWAGRSTEDRNHFAVLFKQLVESIAYPLANEYFGDLKMRHFLIEQKKDDIEVKTLIKGKKSKKRNKEFVMEWYLHPKKDGGWIIYDISIEGERWVPGFRSQFNDVISKKNYAELLKLMKKKLSEELADRKNKDVNAKADRKKGKEG